MSCEEEAQSYHIYLRSTGPINVAVHSDLPVEDLDLPIGYIHFMAPYSKVYTRISQQLPSVRSVVPKTLPCMFAAASLKVQKDRGARLIGCSRFSGVLHSVNTWNCGCRRIHFH